VQIAARLDRMARRRSALLGPWRTVEAKIVRALVQLRCDQARHRPEGSAIVALDETSPAAIGDDVPNLCALHAATLLAY